MRASREASHLDQESVQVERHAAEHGIVANGAGRVERVAIVRRRPAPKQDGNLARMVVEDGIVAPDDARVAAREQGRARLVAVGHGELERIVVGVRNVDVAKDEAHDEFAYKGRS